MDPEKQAPSLDNCDREPIHVPGSVQPHGALLAFDARGRVTHASANTRELLHIEPILGEALPLDALPGAGAEGGVKEAISEALRQDRPVGSLMASAGGRSFDVVIHRQGERVICEFERRDADADVAAFAQIAFRAISDLKQSTGLQQLLDRAVSIVRQLTGFDRVMGYRFAQDDSGEVVAEEKADDLDAYLGRRYPASDIPAQARRLYVLNTLRLIADVAYRPVPIVAAASELEPLDLSHSVLRSVSPIHVEYLTNMGVRASMSVSIVVGGRLWGMIACHHRSPKIVPYPIRMAVDVMAQVISSSVQTFLATRREAAMAAAALVRTEFAAAITAGQDIVEVARLHLADLRATLAADAILLTLDGTPRLDEGVDPAWARAAAAWLATRREGSLVQVVEASQLPPWPEAVAPEDRYCGVLAFRFDGPRQGWLVALRRERVHTIRWGGKPDKVIAHGPLGPRLTPRGSFDEWRETVHGTASPWSPVQREIAGQLADAIRHAYSDRVVELDAMRAHLWAMLGHDLRNPLQSINMASTALDRGIGSTRLNDVIRNSTHRMNRLLGDVLDMSRLQHGFDLMFAMQAVDLSELLRQIVEETTTAHPALAIALTTPDRLPMRGDPGRLAQLFANLLSNARHHGSGDIEVEATADVDAVTVRVSNAGEPISPQVVPTLFDPFKRTSMTNLGNRTGMGLGLYIAAKVAQGHGGSIRYVPGAGRVTFVVTFPVGKEATDVQ